MNDIVDANIYVQMLFFFFIFFTRNVSKDMLNSWNKCRDGQYGVTHVIWSRGKVTTGGPLTSEVILVVYSLHEDWVKYSWAI